MVQAYFINSEAKTVTAIDITTLEELRSYVGGYIECAYMLPNGDHVYVNEEGLLRPVKGFFDISSPLPRSHQAFAGNGVWLGKEVENYPEDEDCQEVKPGTLINVAPATSLRTVQRGVRFSQ